MVFRRCRHMPSSRSKRQGCLDSDEDKDLTIQDVLGAEDERFELIEADVTVAPAIRSLPERERLILHLASSRN